MSLTVLLLDKNMVWSGNELRLHLRFDFGVLSHDLYYYYYYHYHYDTVLLFSLMLAQHP